MPPESTPPASSPPNASDNVQLDDRQVLQYLRSRGHVAAEKALLQSLDSDASPDDKTDTISSEEFLKNIAVFVQKASKSGENALKDSANVLQELTAMGNPSSIQNLISSLGSVGAEEILSLDPTDKQEGFRELEAWVEGSLDMYKVYASVQALLQLTTY